MSFELLTKPQQKIVGVGIYTQEHHAKKYSESFADKSKSQKELLESKIEQKEQTQNPFEKYGKSNIPISSSVKSKIEQKETESKIKSEVLEQAISGKPSETLGKMNYKLFEFIPEPYGTRIIYQKETKIPETTVPVSYNPQANIVYVPYGSLPTGQKINIVQEIQTESGIEKKEITASVEEKSIKEILQSEYKGEIILGGTQTEKIEYFIPKEKIMSEIATRKYLGSSPIEKFFVGASTSFLDFETLKKSTERLFGEISERQYAEHIGMTSLKYSGDWKIEKMAYSVVGSPFVQATAISTVGSAGFGMIGATAMKVSPTVTKLGMLGVSGYFAGVGSYEVTKGFMESKGAGVSKLIIIGYSLPSIYYGYKTGEQISNKLVSESKHGIVNLEETYKYSKIGEKAILEEPSLWNKKFSFTEKATLGKIYETKQAMFVEKIKEAEYLMSRERVIHPEKFIENIQYKTIESKGIMVSDKTIGYEKSLMKVKEAYYGKPYVEYPTLLNEGKIMFFKTSLENIYYSKDFYVSQPFSKGSITTSKGFIVGASKHLKSQPRVETEALMFNIRENVIKDIEVGKYFGFGSMKKSGEMLPETTFGSGKYLTREIESLRGVSGRFEPYGGRGFSINVGGGRVYETMTTGFVTKISGEAPTKIIKIKGSGIETIFETFGKNEFITKKPSYAETKTQQAAQTIKTMQKTNAQNLAKEQISKTALYEISASSIKQEPTLILNVKSTSEIITKPMIYATKTQQAAQTTQIYQIKKQKTTQSTTTAAISNLNYLRNMEKTLAENRYSNLNKNVQTQLRAQETTQTQGQKTMQIQEQKTMQTQLLKTNIFANIPQSMKNISATMSKPFIPFIFYKNRDDQKISLKQLKKITLTPKIKNKFNVGHISKELKADLLSVAISQLKYGKATHPKGTKKQWKEAERRLFLRVPTKELRKMKKGG